MKFGINVWSYPKSLPLEEAMAHAASIGYDAFEVALTLEDWEHWDSPGWVKKWGAIKERGKELGISIPSVATGLFWRFNMLTQPQDALKVVRMECEAAELLGAKLILVVPGVGVPDLSYREHIKRAAAVLKEAGKLAAAHKVFIGVENVWNRAFAGPLEFEMLLDEVGHERIGAYLDVGNVLPHSLPEHWIEVLGKRILQVHVKDYSVAKGTFGVPLSGDVNWSNVRRALAAVNYNGYVVCEVPPYPGDAYQAAEDAQNALREVFGK